jgi:hypothetical protein
MMDNLAQILRRLPTGEAYSSSDHATPFKVQGNFDIPLFEGLIDVDVVDKWFNLLKGYFSVHNFFDKEKITFALLKAIPHVKYWWDTYSEQRVVEECAMFCGDPYMGFFSGCHKIIVLSCWKLRGPVHQMDHPTSRKGPDSTKFHQYFHTMLTKLGIKDSERHLVHKYCSCLHRYIQTEIEFMDIASLGTTYRYAVKIEQKFKKKRGDFESTNPSQPKQGKVGPNPHSKGLSQDGFPQDNHSNPQHMKGNEKTKKDMGKWCEYHKIPWHNTEEYCSK